MQPTMEVQRPTPPRHPGMTQPALDGDYDEELHANVTPPPPPPPPPKRRNSKGGSSRHERTIMMMEEEEQDQQQQQSREPLNSLTPEATQQQQPPYFPSQKEHSGCDPNSNPPIHAATTTTTPTKSKKPPRSGNKPPKQPASGSKSAEYASNLESFHLVMLENIEKETMLIRRTGSFQLNQKNLTNKNNERRQQQQTQNHPDNENLKGAHRGGAKSSASTTMVNGVDANANNVGDLLKETMNDISVAAASGFESLKHVIQHTKAGGKTINLEAVIGPTACGKAEDSATAFMQEDDDDEVESLLKMDDPKVASTPQRSSRKSQQQQAFQLPNIPPGMPKEMMKKMHDAFKKVATEVAAAASDKAGGDKTKKQPRQQRDDENDNSAEAWGVGNLLANGFGWENGDDEDDDRSRATYDTWDEENSVLRRLGSWGTVNSQFTAGTAGTGATFGTMATYDTEGPSVIGPVSAAIAKAAAAKAAAEGGLAVGPNGSPQNGDQLVLPPGSHHLRNSRSQTPTELLHDDDGSLIDPALVEAALKKQEAKKKKKRKGRRKRVVKFDYPPISSLRQYTRPDPEDLPNLFFTEDELDQIEDDRYSTMSTDDIEIVAVASREPDQGEGEEAGEDDDALDAKASAKSKEGGMKSVKGRSGTPTRRRSSGGESGSKKNTDEEGEEANEDADESKRSSPRRLVKGVQIYLRERSTGT